MRILIAEDEVTIARVLKVMLEKNKYAVDMVHNGSDALDYIQAVGYDALVLDIMMPGRTITCPSPLPQTNFLPVSAPSPVAATPTLRLRSASEMSHWTVVNIC